MYLRSVYNKVKVLGQNRRNRAKIIPIILLLIIFFFILYNLIIHGEKVKKSHSNIINMKKRAKKVILRPLEPANKTLPPGFLVYNPSCQIPAYDPIARNVMGFITRDEYESCSAIQPLTRIEYDRVSSIVRLVVDMKLKNSEPFADVLCYYQEIHRSGQGERADQEYTLSEPVSFHGTIELPQAIEYIIVKCKIGNDITLYNNAHAIMRERVDIRKRLKNSKEGDVTRPLSVLMLSIDSISRLNLMRTMPKTTKYLNDNNWFELQGYNKIDDNTYPNLMAILTGYDRKQSYDMCQPNVAGKLDECPLLWKEYRNRGYVTAYGEDETWMSSFNFEKLGFFEPPTDYYQRPYQMAAEANLRKQSKYGMTFCLGYNHSVEHVYQYALDFATMYKDDPYFGLFWSNSFSHSEIDGPTSMDNTIKEYLMELENRGILDTSMIIFFSDHGMRFGPIRFLATAWYEERLPFFYISLPKWFRLEHPDAVQALQINRNRLTNPYDLHMTLKHALELSGRAENLPSAPSCPNCYSLFNEIPWNRSCADANIAAHWCSCQPFTNLDVNDKMAQKAVQFVLAYINAALIEQKNIIGFPLCAEVKLRKLSFCRKSEDGNDYEYYMIVFEVDPSGAWYESTVQYDIEYQTFEISGSISRLTFYGEESSCVTGDVLRKLCFCL